MSKSCFVIQFLCSENSKSKNPEISKSRNFKIPKFQNPEISKSRMPPKIIYLEKSFQENKSRKISIIHSINEPRVVVACMFDCFILVSCLSYISRLLESKESNRIETGENKSKFYPRFFPKFYPFP